MSSVISSVPSMSRRKARGVAAAVTVTAGETTRGGFWLERPLTRAVARSPRPAASPTKWMARGGAVAARSGSVLEKALGPRAPTRLSAACVANPPCMSPFAGCAGERARLKASPDAASEPAAAKRRSTSMPLGHARALSSSTMSGIESSLLTMSRLRIAEKR